MSRPSYEPSADEHERNESIYTSPTNGYSQASFRTAPGAGGAGAPTGSFGAYVPSSSGHTVYSNAMSSAGAFSTYQTPGLGDRSTETVTSPLGAAGAAQAPVAQAAVASPAAASESAAATTPTAPAGEASHYYYASPPPAGAGAGGDEDESLSDSDAQTGARFAPSDAAAGVKRGKTRQSRLTSGSTKTGQTNRSLATSVASKSWLPSKWSALFLTTVVIEAIIVFVLVLVVFIRIQDSTERRRRSQDLKTISVYLALFVFGMLFSVAISLDANRLKNTIQVIGVAVFNVALIVTAALEISQVRDALRIQDAQGGIKCGEDGELRCSAIQTLYPNVRNLLIVVPIIVGVAQIPLTWLTFKLWEDYGWTVYKTLGASIEQRRRFLVYQVYVVLLKYDCFFGVGFSLAYLILVSNRHDAEYGITIAAIPVAIIVLILSAWAVRREYKVLMGLTICAFVAGMVYFIYKITRIYAPSTQEQYRTVRLTLTWFSIFSIVSLALTIANACCCLLNFDKGLKEAHDSMGHFGGKRRRSQADMLDANKIELDEAPDASHTPVSAPAQPRLSLD